MRSAGACDEVNTTTGVWSKNAWDRIHRRRARPSIPDLALEVAVHYRSAIISQSDADILGRRCFEATSRVTKTEFIRKSRKLGLQPEQDAVLEAQWSLVANYGAEWKARSRG